MANGPQLSPGNQRAIRALRAARQRSGGGLPAGAPQIRGPQLAPPVEQPQPAASAGYSSFMPAAAQAVMQQIQADSEQQIQKLTAQEQAAQADLDRQLEEDRERSRRMYSTEMEQETRFLTEEQAQERDERARRQAERATVEGDREDQRLLEEDRQRLRKGFEPRHEGGRLFSTKVQDPRSRGERAQALSEAAERRRQRTGVTEAEEATALGYDNVEDFLEGPDPVLSTTEAINASLGATPENEEVDILTGSARPNTERLDTLATERERAARIARRNRNRSGAGSSPAEAPAAAETAAPAAAAATPTRNVGPMREGYAEQGRPSRPKGDESGPMRDGYVGAQRTLNRKEQERRDARVAEQRQRDQGVKRELAARGRREQADSTLRRFRQSQGAPISRSLLVPTDF